MLRKCRKASFILFRLPMLAYLCEILIEKMWLSALVDTLTRQKLPQHIKLQVGDSTVWGFRATSFIICRQILGKFMVKPKNRKSQSWQNWFKMFTISRFYILNVTFQILFHPFDSSLVVQRWTTKLLLLEDCSQQTLATLNKMYLV